MYKCHASSNQQCKTQLSCMLRRCVNRNLFRTELVHEAILYAESNHLNWSQWKSLDLLIIWCRSLLLLLDQILLPGAFLFQFLHLTTFKCQIIWKHSSHTREQLSESLQSTASIYMLLHFGYLWQFHPQSCEILCQHEVCLMHAHQSWQASSISRFRTAAALSSSRRCAWWQTVRGTFFQPFRNAISRQSFGKFLVMVLVWWLLS